MRFWLVRCFLGHLWLNVNWKIQILLKKSLLKDLIKLTKKPHYFKKHEIKKVTNQEFCALLHNRTIARFELIEVALIKVPLYLFHYLFAAFRMIKAGAKSLDKLSMNFGFADSDFPYLKWSKYLDMYLFIQVLLLW